MSVVAGKPRAPALTYLHRPLSLVDVKLERHASLVRRRREGASFAEVARAAEELTAEGHVVFTLEMLKERVRVAGYAYKPLTIRQSVSWQLKSAEGSLTWARAGWYRLRTTELHPEAVKAAAGLGAGTPGGVGTADVQDDDRGYTTAVRAALNHLLPVAGPAGMRTRRTAVEEWLERSGVPYSGRAVRLGIA